MTGDPHRPAESRPKRRTELLQALALALELPFILVGSVLLGGLVGWWLDGRLHSSPVGMLLLGLLGFAGGVREVLRRVPKE